MALTIVDLNHNSYISIAIYSLIIKYTVKLIHKLPQNIDPQIFRNTQ